MKRTQTGFTMIELIVGILAATALPKFIDLSGDAKLAAVKGMAGSANSVMSNNYSGCASNGQAAAGKCVAITTAPM